MMHELNHSELMDVAEEWPVASHTTLAEGAVFAMVEDKLRTPNGEWITRQYIEHPGAVGVIALDEQDRVVLVRQYRHPVRHRLLEPPAGLLDVDGEDLLTAVQRELAEEVGLAAGDWRLLVDTYTSPGMGNEAIRVFLARELTPVAAPEGFERSGEEAHMDTVLAPFTDVVDAVLAGRLHNPILVAGVLAVWAARTRGGFDQLRTPQD